MGWVDPNCIFQERGIMICICIQIVDLKNRQTRVARTHFLTSLFQIQSETIGIRWILASTQVGSAKFPRTEEHPVHTATYQAFVHDKLM